jgi:hypothetical protein
MDGYLGSSPDPGCQFPASTSPKKYGRIVKNILIQRIWQIRMVIIDHQAR